jgi:hypothetical protein
LGTAHVSFFRAGGQLTNFVSKNITTIERWTSKEPHFSRRRVARYLVGGIEGAHVKYNIVRLFKKGYTAFAV